MIKTNKTQGRKFAGNNQAMAASERPNSTQPSLFNQLNRDNEAVRQEVRASEQAHLSSSNRRQMQMEQIEVADPGELSLTQAVKNRRHRKRDAKMD